MASIYDLKPAFQNLLRPLCRTLVRFGVTANQVTVSAMMLSIVAGAAILWRPGARRLLLLVPIVLFVRMALNAIDGMMAREHAMKTSLGAILNELGDVLSDAALYLPLAGVAGVDARAVVAAVLMGLVAEMTGVVAVQIGAERRYDGPMGKSDRAFVFGALCLLLALGVPRGIWIDLLLWVVVSLLALTILNRARGALGEVRT